MIKQGPSRALLIAAFASIYLIWGSTYLAILYAIETMPPFLMAGFRFIIAGGILYIWARLRGAERPTWTNWRATAIVGGLLLLGGNGSVVWAEQRVATGPAALLITTVPIWMVLLEWVRSGIRPGRKVFGGLLLGFAGLVLLLDPIKLIGSGHIDPLGALVLLFGSFSWASGSLYSRHAKLPSSQLLATAMEMLMGGALLLVLSLFTGQWTAFEPSKISTTSLLSLSYLVVFGSIVAFTAYSWLLQVSTPARVATYAYVNPLVAVFLGWAFVGEPLTMRILLAAAVILFAISLITSYQTQAKKEVEKRKPQRHKGHKGHKEEILNTL